MYRDNISQFEEWLYQMIRDGKEKLLLDDMLIADVLLKVGTAHYHRGLCQMHLKPALGQDTSLQGGGKGQLPT